MATQPAEISKGLDLWQRETSLLERRVVSAYNISSSGAYYQDTTPGLAVYVYGSPGRREMVGGDGDADIIVLEDKGSIQGRTFRRIFTERFKKFDYAKLDLPEWGTLSDAELFLDKSLVEGNQVFETRFIRGDESLNQQLSSLKQKYGTLDRAIKNFFFNRFYLDEYYNRKKKGDATNVKYCRGGSRELLFLSWYNNILELYLGIKKGHIEEPASIISARRCRELGLISEEEFFKIISSIGDITTLRTDMLLANKKTEDRGLTFLDDKTIERLQEMGYPSKQCIMDNFDRNRKTVRSFVDRIYEEVISIGEATYGNSWKRTFEMAAQGSLSPTLRIAPGTSDSNLLLMTALWGANRIGDKRTFQGLAEQCVSTADWSIIGSIVQSQLCSPKLLDYYGRGIAKSKGYGYLLRVIGRNPNTSKETLISIARDPNLEERYTSVAQAALNCGIAGTNNVL